MYFVWGTYTADELILERFGLRHTNTWGTHHVIWLTNECIFPKVDRWGRIYFVQRGSDDVTRGLELYISLGMRAKRAEARKSTAVQKF